MLALAAGCSDGFCPDNCDRQWLDLPPPAIPAPTSPENVIEAIEVIYNDKVRTARDRSQAYASLFDPSFVFHFQAADVDSGLPETWQLEDEVAAHDRMFDGQESGQIYSLEIRVRYGPAIDLLPSTPGSEGWKEVFASNVYLRVMSNLHDGIEVNGGQAVFVFPPPRNGEWKIAAWMDLPSPDSEEGSTIDRGTWGQIKYGYSSETGRLPRRGSKLDLP